MNELMAEVKNRSYLGANAKLLVELKNRIRSYELPKSSSNEKIQFLYHPLLLATHMSTVLSAMSMTPTIENSLVGNLLVLQTCAHFRLFSVVFICSL